MEPLLVRQGWYVGFSYGAKECLRSPGLLECFHNQVWCPHCLSLYKPLSIFLTVKYSA